MKVLWLLPPSFQHSGLQSTFIHFLPELMPCTSHCCVSFLCILPQHLKFLTFTENCLTHLCFCHSHQSMMWIFFSLKLLHLLVFILLLYILLFIILKGKSSVASRMNTTTLPPILRGCIFDQASFIHSHSILPEAWWWLLLLTWLKAHWTALVLKFPLIF